QGVFRGISPSGASTGKHEAVELRDGGVRYFGKGVRKAVRLVNTKIKKKLVGKSCVRQEEIDKLLQEIDGTQDKHKIGANALVACSMAVVKAGAAARNQELYLYLNSLYSKAFGEKVALKIPQGFFNILNGGVHAANKLAFQEFMIVPFNSKFSIQLRMASEIYHNLHKLLIKKYSSVAIGVGDEGGFAPPISRPEEALNLIAKAVNLAGYEKKVKFAMDVAASEFYFQRKGRSMDSGEYRAHKVFKSISLKKYYKQLCDKYPICSIEDPFEENAFSDFSELLMLLQDRKRKNKVQIVGDDLTVTNPERVQAAITEKSANCLLLKVNQIGTVTEALEAAALAQKAGWKIMVSHRSGETEDTFIADLAVGIGSGQMKSGAPCRSERVAKYNRLLRIEEELI
ncbi:phosphopyruvate hydratase, partial [archaeon]|nr:phosphopyruvate hydratase [archaeon]